VLIVALKYQWICCILTPREDKGSGAKLGGNEKVQFASQVRIIVLDYLNSLILLAIIMDNFKFVCFIVPKKVRKDRSVSILSADQAVQEWN